MATHPILDGIDRATPQGALLTRLANLERRMRAAEQLRTASKPTLTYSRAGESTAAAQLRQALAQLGLVTDNTTP